MALKRKRSSPVTVTVIYSPASDTSDATTASSPLPLFYAQSKPIKPLYTKPTWAFPAYDDDLPSGHLNSRTRKRHRDNRPDEQQVYSASCWIGAVMHMSSLADVCRRAANTLTKLYEAQRQLQPNASPATVSSHPSSQQPSQLHSSLQPQRSTLHAFWSINQPPPTVPMAIDSHQHNNQPAARGFDLNCEDCDGPVRRDDAMDLDQDFLEQETACRQCNRRVCDSCAVLGDVRVCLACAGNNHGR